LAWNEVTGKSGVFALWTLPVEITPANFVERGAADVLARRPVGGVYVE
jgi:hypothetical protein